MDSESAAAAAAAVAAAGYDATAAATGEAVKPKRRDVRVAAGKVWVDETLNEWPENDFRLFVGDLAPEADDAALASAFRKYPSFAMAKVVFDKASKKSKGFGFVSMLDVMDAATAIRDMNRKYLLTRPMTVRWSSWQKRSLQSMSADKRKEQMEMVKATQSMNPVEARKQRHKQLKRQQSGTGGRAGRGRGGD